MYATLSLDNSGFELGIEQSQASVTRFELAVAAAFAAVERATRDMAGAFVEAADGLETQLIVLGALFGETAAEMDALGESAGAAALGADVLAVAAADTELAAGALGETLQEVSLGVGALVDVLAGMGESIAVTESGLGELVLETVNADGSMRSLHDVVVDLREAFGQLTEAEQLMAAEAIAGQDGMSGLLAVVSTAQGDFGKLATAMSDAVDAAKKLGEVKLDGLKDGAKATKDALKDVGKEAEKSVSDPLKKVVEEGIKGFTSLATEIAKPLNLDMDSISTFTGGFTSLVSLVENASTTIFPSLASSFTNLQGALKAVSPIGETFMNLWKGTQLLAIAGQAGTVTEAIKKMTGEKAKDLADTTALVAMYAKDAIAKAASAAGVDLLAAKTAIATIAVAAHSGNLSAGTVASGLLTAASKLLGAALNALPLVAVAAAIATVVAGVIKLVQWFNKESEESKQLKSDIEELSKANGELMSSLKDSDSAYQDSIKATETQATVSKDLIDKIYELSEVENKSAEDIALLGNYIDMANDSVEGLNLAFDAETDALNMTRDAAMQYVETLKTQLEAQAAQERYVELAKERYAVEEQLAVIGQKLADAEEEWGEGTSAYTDNTKELREEQEQLKGQLDDNAAAFEYVTTVLEDTAPRQASAIVDSMGVMQLAYDNLEEKQKNVVDSIMGAYGTLSAGLSDLTKEIVLNDAASWEAMKANQETMIGYTEEFSDLYAQLIQAGVSESYLDAIGANSVEAIPLLREMLAAGTDEVLASQAEWEDAYGMISDTLVDALELDDTTAQALRNYISGEAGVAGALKDAIADSGFDEIGLAIDEGLVDGMESGSDGVLACAVQGAADVIRFVKEELGIASPSAVFTEIGENSMRGFAVGFEQNAPQVEAAATGVMTRLVESITGIVAEIPGKLFGAIAGAKERLEEWGASLLAIADARTRELVETVEYNLFELPTRMYDTVFPAVARVDEWITQLIALAQTRFPLFVEACVNNTRPVVDEFYAIGQDMIVGLWEGVESKTSWFYQNIIRFCQELVRKIKQELDIRSPSRVFAEIGQYTAKGFIVGLESMAVQVDRAVADTFGDGVICAYGNLETVGRADVQVEPGQARGREPVVIHQYIQSVNHTPLENELAARAAFTRAGWAL